MASSLQFDLREIPEEGLRLKGEAAEDIFQLNERNTRPDGPIRYDLLLEMVSDSLLIRGSVGVSFLMECVRCLQELRLRVELEDYVLHLPWEGGATIDLTDPIREDILLALPTYPHCEDGTPSRVCPAVGTFERPETSGSEDRDVSDDGPDGWSPLDDFRPSS